MEYLTLTLGLQSKGLFRATRHDLPDWSARNLSPVSRGKAGEVKQQPLLLVCKRTAFRGRCLVSLQLVMQVLCGMH